MGRTLKDLVFPVSERKNCFAFLFIAFFPSGSPYSKIKLKVPLGSSDLENSYEHHSAFLPTVELKCESPSVRLGLGSQVSKPSLWSAQSLPPHSFKLSSMRPVWGITMVSWRVWPPGGRGWCPTHLSA